MVYLFLYTGMFENISSQVLSYQILPVLYRGLVYRFSTTYLFDTRWVCYLVVSRYFSLLEEYGRRCTYWEPLHGTLFSVCFENMEHTKVNITVTTAYRGSAPVSYLRKWFGTTT